MPLTETTRDHKLHGVQFEARKVVVCAMIGRRAVCSGSGMRYWRILEDFDLC